ncbi:type II toxin-antitoxin system HicB family antitoxin [Acidaminobacter sp.]|uniref:type II toxin-antitoxin system HicB family antitoxin n=1 Tax=Acidaminobacter sp. TaxID=1872102 RepID=UPI0013810176|nr:type II toxin-antitoxin system HicB family antitoxin [Acidaminobacter sp.]MDK9710408.1 type II toxin-antitoxin system HicB family antitoxin [Acidaminobacter sp.]MZQ96063.1 type II toxin-antitoxin system HicB family antitoxin [Acidaminobacter sp.]
MKFIYPVIFRTVEDGFYAVSVPDLPGCFTQGKDLQEAYEMAQDAIALWICDSEDNSESIPLASDIHLMQHDENEFISLVSVDTTEYRAAIDNKAIKKTLTIPSWLNRAAEKQHLNFSQILQEALKKKLHI